VIQYGLCENGYELLAPNKQVFIDLLNNYWTAEEDSVP
jgi:hypothetical protein